MTRLLGRQRMYGSVRMIHRTVMSMVVLAGAGSAAGEIVEFQITLDGWQEQPTSMSTATGSGVATLDTDSRLFSWEINFSGLSSNETAAHFHGNAPECENAGVQVALSLGSPKIGSATLTESQANAVLDGLWYVNIHTQNFAPGEIRGQVLPAPLEEPIPNLIPAGAVHARLVPVVSGMTAPTAAAAPPGIEGRLFISDQDGTLWNVDLATGEKLAMLDVDAMLVTIGVFGPDSFDERGLLGVAIHPDYQQNGLIYTYTSEPANTAADYSTMPVGIDPDHQSVIREWQVVDPADAETTVNMATVRELLRVDQPQFNHNAGALQFGPDNLLYIAFGDGGGADDADGQMSLGAPMRGHGCEGNGQDASNPLGAVLRIDPLGSDGPNGQYGIPKDNPFVGVDGMLDEIYAYGFRNPWRFSFDSMTGELYLGDVGQNDVEEVNIVTKGGNYGWRHKEGSFTFIANGIANGYVTDREIAGPSGLIDPIAEYANPGDGIAVIGGYVYHGDRIPALQGHYVFGDWSLGFGSPQGRVFYLDDAGDIAEMQVSVAEDIGRYVLGFAEDHDGELFVLSNTTGTPFGDTGMLHRLAPKVGDLNADGVVNVLDLLSLLGAWGECGDPSDCPQDLNEDGSVNVLDLLAMLGNWG